MHKMHVEATKDPTRRTPTHDNIAKQINDQTFGIKTISNLSKAVNVCLKSSVVRNELEGGTSEKTVKTGANYNVYAGKKATVNRVQAKYCIMPETMGLSGPPPV